MLGATTIKGVGLGAGVLDWASRGAVAEGAVGILENFLVSIATKVIFTWLQENLSCHGKLKNSVSMENYKFRFHGK